MKPTIQYDHQCNKLTIELEAVDHSALTQDDPLVELKREQIASGLVLVHLVEFDTDDAEKHWNL